MKLAEVLVERKALKDEIQDLRRRLQKVTKVQGQELGEVVNGK